MTEPLQIDKPTGWRGWLRANRLFVSAASHLALFVLAWILSFGLAYNFRISPEADWLRRWCLPLLLPVIVIKLGVFMTFGLHRGWWRYVSLRDILSITKAAWISFFGIWLLISVVIRNPWLVGLADDPLQIRGDQFPESVYPLDFGLTIALVAGARFAVRLYHEEVRPSAEGSLPRLLILGAGNAGENAVRELMRSPVQHYRIVGFLDDNRDKHGAHIHGMPVLGPIASIKEYCEEHDVEEILIAMPSASKERIRRVVELCQGTNLKFKTLPAIEDLIAGRATVSEIREVDINDVLGRDPVKLDEQAIGSFIADRVIMITGAGGSIGSEMCRQIAKFKPRRMLLVEQAEGALFEIDRELKRSFDGLNCVPLVADIADRGRMNTILDAERPSAVFHAAAHKHVPMMEDNPSEAVKNNINGTRVVADASARAGVEKFVMISTDKAVNPTSIMGASKRVAEMYIQGLNARTNTQFVTVRFGNVLGSSGSVIPIFKQQIARGGPVTVTHPDMVRYFMTIPEAAQLVLQAASMGEGGEIFVLDMGEPVKIVDLARDLITLSGFRPDIDIKIEFSGIRPGEKLFEELAIEGEDVARTPHPKVGIWRNIPVPWEPLLAQIDRICADADTLHRANARDRFREIVPEFYLEAPAARVPAGVSAHTARSGAAAANGTAGPEEAVPAIAKPAATTG
ncbi:MAG: nucleoside-diphosphate sugar epimerase/dehydratase [Phycisphaerae bacterium]|nr:nucleoside-diphosphate sugar epimerase/dehydratase [Phycisphaerae bacterium]